MPSGWCVAAPNEYLVITGAGIDDVLVVKKRWVHPFGFQRCRVISLNPFDLEIDIQATSKEKLSFLLPVVLTVGPDENPENLVKYAKTLTGLPDQGRRECQRIVRGIVEGEIRGRMSALTLEEVFQERQMFQNEVVQQVQGDLGDLGLKIYNANIKELEADYFTMLSQKAHEGASNQAKVDVANARMMGEIGEADKVGKTKQEISRIEAETAVLQTKRNSEKATAEAEYTGTQTKLNMAIQLGRINADRQAEARDAELQRDVQIKRKEMELERVRATDLVQATIAKESAQQAAEAQFFTKNKVADSKRYRANQDAEAKLFADTKNAEGVLYKQRQDAEAAYYRTAKEAEASLYAETKHAEAVKAQAEANFFAKKREAEGTTEMAKAYGHMSDALGGPQQLMQYLMLTNGTYEKLAHANAAAINGLQPKITVWNTNDGSGSSSNSNDNGLGAIRNIMQALPPMLSTINEQTGMQPPSWLAKMPGENSSQELVNGKGKVNGTT